MEHPMSPVKSLIVPLIAPTIILVGALLLLTSCLCTPSWLTSCSKQPQTLCPGVIVQSNGQVVCTREKTKDNPNPCQWRWYVIQSS